MGFLEVFDHLLKKFLIRDHETWFTGILWVLSGVCEKWPLWAKFSGRFGPVYGRNMSIFRIVSNFLKSFNWNHMKHDLLAHCSCLCRCVKDRPQRPKFTGHFGPPNRSKFKFVAMHIDCEIVIWQFHSWLCIDCFTVSRAVHCSLLVQWGLYCSSD